MVYQIQIRLILTLKQKIFMKKFSILLAFAIALMAASPVFGQGRFGADSAECIKYLSFYQEYMKQGNLAEADPLWQKAISLCPPTANQNMLLDGMKILRRNINVYKNNPIRKKSLIDSLMMLHQMRIDNYPKYIIPAKTNQAMDMMKYSPKGQEKEVFTVLGEAMDVAKGKTAIAIPVRYMDYANELYKAGNMQPEEVMEAYQKAMATAELIEKAKPSEDIVNAKKDIENLLMLSGVASCDNLIALFTPRYEANPNDKDVLANIVSMLSASQCLDADLFLNAVESLHKIETTNNSAYLLFKLYSQRDDYSKASEYMQEALNLLGETDPKQSSDYYFEYSTYCFKKAGKPGEAVKAAKSAAELNPEIAGKAYFLIGTIWGAQKCEGNDIEVRAPYWVAVDYLVKAKNADPALAEEANTLISSYSKYFPQQSEAFMFDVLDGSTYTVSCGSMRESTKVRTQK